MCKIRNGGLAQIQNNCVVVLLPLQVPHSQIGSGILASFLPTQS